MLVFVSAAEASSDIYAQKIISEWKKLFSETNPNEKFEVFGIGGPELRSLPYFQGVIPAEKLRAMGFIEVLKNIFTIRKAFDQITAEIRRRQPHVILTFDYPDFHMRLISRLGSFNALKICMIPPKVWVWRSGRIHKLRRLYDGVGVIFPFEKEMYRRSGIPVLYCGNPLVDGLPLQMSRADARIALGLPANDASDELTLAFLPGSRRSELNQHLPLMPKTLQQIQLKTGKKIQVIVPISKVEHQSGWRAQFQNTDKIKYVFVEGRSHLVLRACEKGIIKSGTSVLESVLLGCQPVVIYKVPKTTEIIFKFIVRYLGPVSLPNILLGLKKREDSIFKELLGPEVTPVRIAEEFLKLDTYRDKQEAARERLLADFNPSTEGPSRWAEGLESWRKTGVKSEDLRKSKIWIGLLSFLWSSLNFFRRKFATPKVLKKKSILVGNLQAGGAAKTPIIIALAQTALAKNIKVAVVSRGYGRKSTGLQIASPGEKVEFERFGDELTEVRLQVPEVWICACNDRNEAAQKLENVDLILFDDGFQNLKFKATFTILCLTDASRFQSIFRDFDSQAAFADIVIKTKARLPTVQFGLETTPTVPVSVILGVADPKELLANWKTNGMQVMNTFVVKDHSAFEPTVVRDWILHQEKMGFRVVTTQKDSVRLSAVGIPCINVKSPTLTELNSGIVGTLIQHPIGETKSIFSQIIDKLMKS